MNIRAESLKNIGIDYALIAVTKRCNLLCKHCRAEADSGAHSELSTDILKDVIKSLSRQHTRVLVFTGGEPLLRNDLEESIAYASSLGMRCRLQTNGWFLTQDRIERLKKAGIFNIGIGLDSPYEDVHDRIRGLSGSYKRAIQAIKLVVKNNIKCHVEYALMKENASQLHVMFKMLNDMGVRSFLVRGVVQVGRADTDNFLLTSTQYYDFLKELYNLSIQYPKITSGSQDPLYLLVNDKYRNDIMAKLKALEGKTCIAGCTMGINTLFIRSDGNVTPCTFTPDFILGNIYESSLDRIWEQRFENEKLYAIATRNLSGACSICDNCYICGGCRARAKVAYKDELADDPYCWRVGQ